MVNFEINEEYEKNLGESVLNLQMSSRVRLQLRKVSIELFRLL